MFLPFQILEAKSLRTKSFFFLICLWGLSFVSFGQEKSVGLVGSTLSIKTPTQTISYQYQDLLQMADSEPLLIKNDPVYKTQKIAYRVLLISKLFQKTGIKPDQIIQFKCWDGFSGPINNVRLLNTDPKKAIAYLAIEPIEKKWPALKPGSAASAGPYFVVWKNAELSSVGPEEWPFQLMGFEVKKSLKDSYPLIFPDNKSANRATYLKGLEVFTKNCFTCHTINKSGEATMGPDLNFPYNPTEYFHAAYLEKLIRNPQQLRSWANSKMPAFSEKIISKKELSLLLQYLKHMRQRKIKAP